jgi:hypothetical protein
MSTITLKKIDTGLYLHEPTGWLVMKDGYSSPREAEAAWRQELSRGVRLPGGGFGPSSDFGDKRLKGFRFDGIEYEPEEVCWVVVDNGDSNIDITDTLRDARAVIEREWPRAAGAIAGRFIKAFSASA